MSGYKAVRGKTVILGRVFIEVDADGSVAVKVGREHPHEPDAQQMILSEEQASELHDLMNDVLEWDHSGGTGTLAHAERLGERVEAEIDSGRMDDERASGR